MKDYVDRGVQTSPLPSHRADRPKVEVTGSSPGSPSKSAYSHSLSPDAAEFTLTRADNREYSYQQLGRRRPTQWQDETSRIVSLPETEPQCLVKTTLESTTVRVVSMPQQRRRSSVSFSISSPSTASRQMDQSDLSRSEEYSARKRTRSGIFSHETPRTPSPPSSPDSVLIIANNSQLPDAFLRRKRSDPKVKRSAADDDGWITWTNSPPRPIPALHGPLSLPYARCPSGAEGTIIEEQDHLPRVIWGLDSENAHPSHIRFDSVGSIPPSSRDESYGPRKVIPPRLQKMQAQGEIGKMKTSQCLSSSAYTTMPTNTKENHRKPPVVQSNLPFSPRGADLGTRLPAKYALSKPPLGEDEMLPPLHMNAQLHSRQNAPLINLNELPHEWQAILGEHNLNVPRSLTHATRADEFVHYLKATAPAFVPSLSLEGLYHPRVVVEPRTAQTSQHSSHRRLPTIDLTQPYLHFPVGRHGLLPTPPSSSSPLWSSDFSPYQEPLLSPTEMAASLLPRMSSNVPNQAGNTAVTEQLRRALYERLSTVSTLNPDTVLSLAPAAQIHGTRTSRPLVSSQGTALRAYLNAQDSHPALLSSPQAASSPPRPRVPPNTPLRNLAGLRHDDIGHNRSQSVTSLPTPPSPRSPETHATVYGNLKALSGQQPRSIPLAKLIQRRLSAVPEAEEEATFVRSRTPSPSRSYLEHHSPRTLQDEVPVQIYSTERQPHSEEAPPAVANIQQVRGRRNKGNAVIRDTSRSTGVISTSNPAPAPAKASVAAKAVHEEVKGKHSAEGSKVQGLKRRPYRKKNRTPSLDSTATIASVAASSSKE